MTTYDPSLQIPSFYEQPKLKSLPLREQPAYRVSQNAAACNLTELLAAVIGGQRQIEIQRNCWRVSMGMFAVYIWRILWNLQW